MSNKVGFYLHGGHVTPDDVSWLESKLMFDRLPAWDRYLRFFVLAFLSTVIATYGVTRNSAATVIGAMIVAPLMTPLMAVSLSTVAGDARNLMRSMLVVVIGTATVVGLSILLYMLFPGNLSITDNAQIMSRVAPHGIDLIIALAAGAAGAFVTSREDVSDALPGVAIAVSLVPPLAVTGICIGAGRIDFAWDAFLLFLTNLVAIIAAGLVVFAIMGFGKASLGAKSGNSRRVAISVIVIGTIIIATSLGFETYSTTCTENLRRDAKEVAERWLAGTDYEIDYVEADIGEVHISISGNGERPDFEEYVFMLESFAPNVDVRMRVNPEERIEGRTGGG